MLTKVIIGAEQSQSGRGFNFYKNTNTVGQENYLPPNWDLRADKEQENDYIRIALAGSVYSASKMMKSS